MERKIGEIFEYNGEWYQCVEHSGCYGCAFDGGYTCRFKGDSYCATRSDKKLVIYKKLEKVGEPYEDNGSTVQRYRIHYDPIIAKSDIIKKYVPGLIDIEIKPSKEDMEKKKFNLKPFDIQKAKDGKPVCTRDGRKVRIICFDRNDLYPIVALIENEDGTEMAGAYSNEGQTEIYETKCTDLMMLPEKKEGWVVILKEAIFDTEEEAKLAADESGRDIVKIQKVEW